MKRLSFQLPDFTRISWVSARARSVWQPRISRITNAWLEIEWRSVLAGVRPCCLTSVSPEELIAKAGELTKHGLCALPLQKQGVSQYGYSSTSLTAEPGKPFLFRIVAGTPENAYQFKQAFDAGNDRQIGHLLGFPTCCQEFFQQVWVEQGCVDTTWQMAANTVKPPEDTQLIEVNGSPYANILWRWVGPRPVPHLPCRFDCAATIQLGEKLIQVGRDAGYTEEMDWLLELLDWSVEWSALHGIAEIKTPILKVSTRTDATPCKYTVCRTGETAPLEAAKGLNFPYQTPRKPLLTGSTAFQRGIDNPIAAAPQYPDWYATDNGFSSRLAMDSAHQPIVDLAVASLPATPSTAIDLGCGNGALLEKIQARRPEVVPYGIELDASRFERIALLLPEFADNFVLGDLFANEQIWTADRHYSLAILMPGRLLEVDAAAAEQLRQQLQRHGEQILVYAYGDWLTRYGDLAGLVAAAGLELVHPVPNAKAGLALIRSGG